MEKRAQRNTLLGVLVAGLWACGLGAAGTMAVEPGPSDATATDASSDAPSLLDTLSSDASVEDVLVDVRDAQDAPADAPVTYCLTVSPAPTFCADFDDPANASPSAGWESTTADAGAAVTASTTVYASAPRSLHSTSTLGSSAAVKKSFPMTSQVSVEFDVRFTVLPTSGDVSPIKLTPPAFPGMDVYFFVHSTGSYFQEFGDDYSPSLAAPSLNTWHHIAITIATNGTTSRITASMDGAAAWTNHTLLHSWPTPTTANLDLGLASLYQVTNSEAFVDNVVVRVQ